MKALLKLLILFFSVVLQSQNLPVEKLLLTKKYENTKLPKEEFFLNNFSKNIFILDEIDSIVEYHSLKVDKMYSVDKNIGSCIFLTLDKKDFNKVVDRLNLLILEGYNVFKDDNQDDYKSYLEFVYKGLIVTTMSHINQIILIYMNTCIFEENRLKIIKNIKSNNLFSQSYIFNCGSKQIFQKIKESSYSKG